MVEPTERMPREKVNTILTALMSAEGALDLVYRKTSIETYGRALAQIHAAGKALPKRP
jgi:hypothetical protein